MGNLGAIANHLYQYGLPSSKHLVLMQQNSANGPLTPRKPGNSLAAAVNQGIPRLGAGADKVSRVK